MPRDPEKLRKRNQRLHERFDYWYNKKRYRYDDVISILEDEFFLARSTIERYLEQPVNK